MDLLPQEAGCQLHRRTIPTTQALLNPSANLIPPKPPPVAKSKTKTQNVSKAGWPDSESEGMSTDMATMVKTVVDVATKVAGEIVMEKSNQKEAEGRALHELTSNGNFNEDDRLYDKATSTKVDSRSDGNSSRPMGWFHYYI